MNIYMNGELLGETGQKTGFRDILRRELYTGDLVVMLSSMCAEVSTVVMRHGKPVIMGIVSSRPEFNAQKGCTEFVNDDGPPWSVRRIKKYTDVVAGEKLTQYRIEFRDE